MGETGEAERLTAVSKSAGRRSAIALEKGPLPAQSSYR
jgi:hypothetical protein